MKIQSIKSVQQTYQPNHVLGIYILSITFLVAGYTMITAVQYL